MEEKKRSRFNNKYIIGGIIFLLFWVIGQNALNSAKDRATTSHANEQGLPRGEEIKGHIFDVPALLGKNVDEIEQTLGESEKINGVVDEPTDLQLELGTTEWDRTWKKGGYELLVTYNVKTRQVKDFFIPLQSGGSASDINQLLRVGNLQKGAPEYTIKSVEALNEANTFTGIIVTPID
jgi:hypothetical protein